MIAVTNLAEIGLLTLLGDITWNTEKGECVATRVWVSPSDFEALKGAEFDFELLSDSDLKPGAIRTSLDMRMFPQEPKP